MAVHLAGAKLAAQDMDQVVSADTQLIGAAQTTTTINMTTTAQDLTGTSLTFTTSYANTLIGVWAVFDVNMSTTDATTNAIVFIGTCLVDGVVQSGEAHAGANRVTCAQYWIATLTSAGSHTIKLQGKVNSLGAGSTQTNNVHTKWTGFVLGP